MTSDHPIKKAVITTLVALFLAVLFAPLAVAEEQEAPRASIDISGHPFIGPAEAPVTVVVFSDYL